MRLATIAQSREIDELAQRVYQLSDEVLMESAGALAAREIEQSYFPELNKGSIAVICGTGHNGGDGLVVARHLHSSGYRDLDVYLADFNKPCELYLKQLKRCELQGIKIHSLKSDSNKISMIRDHEIIVDAMFGIGLNKSIEGEFLKIIEAINSSKKAVVSLDVPTGLDCDRGTFWGACVRAAMTITFGLAKPGFFVLDGPSVVGKLRVLQIGFPFEALRGVATSHFLFTEKLARRYLPIRKEKTNKSDYGHLLVCAGRDGMWGAGLLAASSAYRFGAGYVTWASFDSLGKVGFESPEILTAQLTEGLPKEIKKPDAVVVGPGLGITDQTFKLIKSLKDNQIASVLLDADAITLIAQHKFYPLPKTWIVTPHVGELSRLLGVDVHEIERDRFKYAHMAGQLLGCHVLVKGYRSVLAYDNRSMIIHSGNSALAKAGSGDVLSGMIGSLLAQGLDPVQATGTAAYVHGRLADEWVRQGWDKRSLLPSDIRDQLPGLVGRITGGKL